MAEGPGDRLKVHSRLCRPRVALTRRPRRVTPSATRRRAGRPRGVLGDTASLPAMAHEVRRASRRRERPRP